MRDPRAGAGLPALQLPDRGARCGSRWANLLLRSLRAYGRQNNVEGPRLTLQAVPDSSDGRIMPSLRVRAADRRYH
jgi:hypothetical protein